VSRDGEIRLAYQANLVPTVVLIDREGNMVKRLVGFKDPAVLEAEIAGLF
jgi:thioredoxin-related protein